MNNMAGTVISLHGIRTQGIWQEKLNTSLTESGIIHKPFKYGYYDVYHFLRDSENCKMVERFYEFYCGLNIPKGERPSLVAHSFGTFILANCLQKREHLKFDKIILCGSILPKNFDWSLLLARNQVNQVRNEYSRLDFWTKVVKRFVRRTGQSGYSGSSYRRPNFFEKRYDYKHSDYFAGKHMDEYWIPFLKEVSPIFEVKQGGDLLLDDYYRILQDCKDIDYECFGAVSRDPAVGIPDGLAKRWVSINEDIYTFVKEQSNDSVKGYLNAMPLNKETFEAIKSGAMLDKDIQEDNIQPYLKNTETRIYFMSIATRLDVRSFRGGLINTVGDRLLSAFFKKLIDYWENDHIKVVEFVTIAWTPQGKVICESAGMTQVGFDCFGHPIYYLKTSDMAPHRNFFLQGYDNLLNSYQKKKKRVTK